MIWVCSHGLNLVLFSLWCSLWHQSCHGTFKLTYYPLRITQLRPALQGLIYVTTYITNRVPASYKHAHGVVPIPTWVHCITLNQCLVHEQPQQDNLTAIFSFKFDNMKMPSDSFIIKSWHFTLFHSYPLSTIIMYDILKNKFHCFNSIM